MQHHSTIIQNYVFGIFLIIGIASSSGFGLIITCPTTVTTWTLYTTVHTSWTYGPSDGNILSKIDVVSSMKTQTLTPDIPLSRGAHSFVLSGIVPGQIYLRISTDAGVVESTGYFQSSLQTGDRVCKNCTFPFQTCISNGPGCESNSKTDPANCDACGKACSSNNVQSLSCSSGICNGPCLPGYADCNFNKLSDGCETDAQTDANNCGFCATICSSNNMATRTCNAGSCNGNCALGFEDCNNNKQTDGCEINIFGDANNCGTCGTACSSNNMATRTCTGGVCNGDCNFGFADCNNNKQTDGCEINISGDSDNCGSCGTICSNNNIATRTCAGGTCNGGCNAGFFDCNNNKLLDGCEIDTQTDVDNCGSCSTICSNTNMATRTCGAGSCDGNCAVGFDDCNNNKLLDGCEIDISNDNFNCGICGNVCGGGLQCINYVCV